MIVMPGTRCYMRTETIGEGRRAYTRPEPICHRIYIASRDEIKPTVLIKIGPHMTAQCIGRSHPFDEKDLITAEIAPASNWLVRELQKAVVDPAYTSAYADAVAYLKTHNLIALQTLAADPQADPMERLAIEDLLYISKVPA